MNPSAQTAAADVVVVGSINVDEVVTVARHPQPGETLLATGSHVSPGGKGANQALAAARLSTRVSMVGAVGDDGRRGRALDLLEQAGVDTATVATVPGSSGIARITVDADGENTIIVIAGANETVDAAYVAEHRTNVAGARVVVLQGEIPADGSAEAARLATGRVVLNLAPVIEVSMDLLSRADPLVVNEHEARLLARQLELAAAGDEADDGDLAEALHEFGVRSVVLTQGAAGAVCVEDGTRTAVRSPRVSALDTSGAGDAFVGALAARLAAGDELTAACRYAARVGAFAVQGAGTQPSYPFSGDELPEV